MRKVYHYRAYNLGLCSALPLPELQSSVEAEADVSIRIGPLDWPASGSTCNDDDCGFHIQAGEAWFRWDGLGKFLVRDGREIIIDPVPGVAEGLIRLPLLGTVLAVLLHQTGRLVLHASAVAIDDESVIFMGNKGWGKSTMAATLYGRGHQLLADDVVVLDFDAEGQPRVLPGFPQVKLYPGAVMSSLGSVPEEMAELAEGYEKRGCRLDERFSHEILPLKCIYTLAVGDSPSLHALTQHEAIIRLISNTYVARYGKQFLGGAGASTHLRQCVRVINKVPVYRLSRPNGLWLLPSIANLVERHVGALGNE